MEQSLMDQHVSALEDPGRASDVAQQLLGDDKPKVEPLLLTEPPDCTVTLPGGLVQMGGEVIQVAEVRELTGADEEALTKAGASMNPARYMQMLIKRAVVRIGDAEPPTPDMLSALLIGDRNTLLLEIRKATYGNEIEVAAPCPGCAEVLDIVFDISKDVPIHVLEDPTQRIYEVELRHGRKAKVALPCAGDQDAMIGEGKRTVPEMNTFLLARCVQDIDGRPVMGAPDVRNLGLLDRRTILDFIAKTQPGPKYEEVKEECPACGREVPVPLDLFDLFRS